MASHTLTALTRRSLALWAVTLPTLLLLGCSGGDSEPTASQAATSAVPGEASSGTAGRVFKLWEPGTENQIREEQRQHDDAADANTVQLIVRLNPAAVLQPNRLAIAGAVGNGESGDAAALRATQLAAKVQAVALAADGVMAQSIRRVAPQAAVLQQFSHALEALVIAVPWTQAQEVATDLASNPAVDGVEPVRSYSVDSTTGVRTLNTAAWGVDRIDQRSLQFDGSFRQTLTGAGVSVYVVDTGVNPHTEFGTRLAAGYTAINDGRGTGDCTGHGTHVAGSAVGATVGVAPGARLVPVRVMNCTGSTSSRQIFSGLDWVIANGSKPGVVNMSLGGTASSAMDAATARLISAGFSVVASAGNSNANACFISPARGAGVVSVAASDRSDAKASYSNWGTCVSLWAPGSAIVSASSAGTTSFATSSGTSMAAPHATGALALLLEESPSLSPALARGRLLARATTNTVTATPADTTRSMLFAGSDTPTTPPPVVVALGTISTSTQIPAAGTWLAAATVAVVNVAGQAVTGATVTARYSNMSSDVSCTTAASGSCTLTSAAASWSTTPTLGLTITQITGNNLSYTGGTRSVQIERPAATLVTVAALTGTVVRSTAPVGWNPQFTVTVRNVSGATVPSARVFATMTIFKGAEIEEQYTFNCITGATGQCAFNRRGTPMDTSYTRATLQVNGVSGTNMTYLATGNTTASVAP